MPYIKQEYRDQIDPVIDELLDVVRDINSEPRCLAEAKLKTSKLCGIANYIVTRVACELLNNNSYDSLSNIVKTLECSKLEVVRRLLDPYEDLAIAKNGDIQSFVKT
jgi:hypothetical protein